MAASVSFTLEELKADGFGVRQLRDEGFMLPDLRKHFSIADMRKGACTPQELLAIEVTIEQLREGGYSVQQLVQAALWFFAGLSKRDAERTASARVEGGRAQVRALVRALEPVHDAQRPRHPSHGRVAGSAALPRRAPRARTSSRERDAGSGSSATATSSRTRPRTARRPSSCGRSPKWAACRSCWSRRWTASTPPR